MSDFTVSWVYKAIDKFSLPQEKMRRASEKFQKQIEKNGNQLKRYSQQFKDFRKSVTKTGRKLRNFGSVMTAGVTLPLVLMSKNMISSASDAVETANKFNTIFAGAGDAGSVANQFAKDFGLAGSSSQKMLSDVGDLLTTLGFTSDEALDLSVQVSSLGADLTSFKNFAGGAEGATLALVKAMLGETESAKSLGLSIRMNSDEFKALERRYINIKGLTKTQARAMSALTIITNQSRLAIGDTSRTWNDYAAVSRRVKESNKDLRESFGQDLLPLAKDMSLVWLKVTEKMRGLDSGTKSGIVVFGAFLAVLGPLLAISGLIAIAIGTLTLPVVGLIALFAALAVGTAIVVAKWDKLKIATWDFIMSLGSSPAVKAFMKIVNTISSIPAKIAAAKAAVGNRINQVSDAFTSITADAMFGYSNQVGVNIDVRDPGGVIDSVDGVAPKSVDLSQRLGPGRLVGAF